MGTTGAKEITGTVPVIIKTTGGDLLAST